VSVRTDIVNTPQDQRGKAAFRALVDASGGQDGAAATTGKVQQRISLLGHPNSDAFPTLNVIAQLEAVTHGTPGHPHVTRYLAREAGYELFKLPEPRRVAISWGALCASLTKEHSDVMTSVCTALDDNTLNKTEARKCLAELDEDLVARMHLRAALLAVLEAE
jgi:hypothetical protein